MIPDKFSQATDLSAKRGVARTCVHSIREWFILARHLPVRRSPRLVAFPCSNWDAGSCLLWGKGALNEMRRLGWDVLLVPGQLNLKQRQRICRILKPDAVVFIKARTWMNHPLLFDNFPTVFLIDDADFLDPNEISHVQQCVSSARLVIAGNEFVAKWCRQYSNNVEVVWVPHPPRDFELNIQNLERKPVVIWAHSRPSAYPQESSFVQSVLLELVKIHDHFEFWITGCTDNEWTENFLMPLKSSGISVRHFGYFKNYSDYLSVIAEAAVGIHPVRIENPYSNGKSFGKLLSYMICETAVVTDPVLDHIHFFRHEENGMLASSPTEYAKSINFLLMKPAARGEIARRAYTDFCRTLATPVVADRLSRLIMDSVGLDSSARKPRF